MIKKLVCVLLVLTSIIIVFPASAFARDELKNTDPSKYYILLDANNQVVTVYEKDKNGEYTRIVRRMICTSGRTEIDPLVPEDMGTPTPRGTWKIGGRERFGKFASFGAEYARYWTQIVGGVYFHSIMFGKRNVDALKSSPYSTLGNAASHGCVRLYVEDAKWLYYYACPGTTVTVSYRERLDPELTAALKSDIPFKEYNKLQKRFYDEPELDNLTAWIVKDNADMRTGNGSNDNVIKKLDIDTEVEVLQLAEPWCKIKYDGREGYMRLAYLTFEKGTVSSSENADILKATAYMYKEADDDSGVICKVPAFTSVKVLDNSVEKWCKVEYYDETGYIPSRYIVKGWGSNK